MKKVFFGMIALASIGLTFSLGFCARKESMLYPFLQSVDDVVKFFPQSVDDIQSWSHDYRQQVVDALDALIAIPADQKTFENTARALDNISSLSQLALRATGIEVVQYVYPDEAMRNAAREQSMELQSFWIDTISTNKKLYEAFKHYFEGNFQTEQLTNEQRYYVEESMQDFKRAGLHLPDEQLEKVKKLKKELTQLGIDFEKNIAQDSASKQLVVQKDGLIGVSDDFIDALKRTDDGGYILPMDYPTQAMIMENCRVEQTRKDYYRMFANRAYPQNETILKDMIAKRDELAKLLGFESFSALNIDDSMAHTVGRVEEFLNGLLARVEQKVKDELKELTKQLPQSVSLTKDGLVKPWDLSFIKNEYKKVNYAIDEQELSEYFPMEQTVEQLLDIYRQFLNVTFDVLENGDFWHEDVRLVRVSTQDGQQLGYLLLDLYPRPGKYTHAAHVTVFPSLVKDGQRKIAVSMVMANFPKPMAGKPSLLKRNDVSTFFHEFGHAMHAMLSQTTMAGFAGTSVKRDFVEMPSQMLEEWLYDPAILKKVSHHYQTGESLPDELIEKIIALKNLTTGLFIQRQGFLATLALEYFKAGADKDPYAILQKLYKQIVYGMELDPEYRMFAAFGHLPGYAAKYYGYLWSKVFALDLFDTIKKEGLLNGQMGQKYIDAVLSKGGSKDPNQLLIDFLGREPNDTAFLRDLGLA